MNTHDDNALTPDERALAQRLSKLGPQAEPSPSLDARILAMAHAAAAEPPADVAPPRVVPIRKRKPQTWVTTLGFAASLAVACGIAWNLRELPDTAPAPAPAAQAPTEEAVQYQPPPPPSMSARVVPRRPLNVPAPPPQDAVATQRQSTSRARARPAPKQESFTHDPPLVLDEAVHAAAPRAADARDAAAVESAPEPTFEIGKLPVPRVVDAPAPLSRAAATSSPAAPPAPRQREAATFQRSAERHERDAYGNAAAKAAAAAEPESAEADEEVVPPATANDPAVREAWLARIRELVRTGHMDEARESLHAFRARYPGHALPEDLRTLGE